MLDVHVLVDRFKNIQQVHAAEPQGRVRHAQVGLCVFQSDVGGIIHLLVGCVERRDRRGPDGSKYRTRDVGGVGGSRWYVVRPEGVSSRTVRRLVRQAPFNTDACRADDWLVSWGMDHDLEV